MPGSSHNKSLAAFDLLLEQLALAREPADAQPLRSELLCAAEELLASDAGLAALDERAPRFERKGVFRHGPWADAARLVPALVKSGLIAEGPTGVIEALSELRLLAIAGGRADSDRVTADEARGFLERALALCLDLLVPAPSEANREKSPARERAERVCAHLVRSLSLGNLLGVVAVELDQLLAQRPLQLDRALELLRIAGHAPLAEGDTRPARLERYLRAIAGPSPMAQAHPDGAGYRAALLAADAQRQLAEATQLGESLRATGLACPQHALAVREWRRELEPLARALGLNQAGRFGLDAQHAFVTRLIEEGIFPATAQSLYGLARMLERGVLAHAEVRAGFRRLFGLRLAPAVAERLAERFGPGVTPHAHVVAAACSVLGQPLGIGQGHNPTCQSARAVSLWAQLSPGYLLAQLACVARADRLEFLFEGELLRTDELAAKPEPLDPELDAVSLLLVPHLDRLYEAMMLRAADRDADGHRWVNPALYGPWVPPHLASVFALPYREFVRRFYASHHPDYSGHYGMIHPTPVGLFVTNAHGALLGRHAITLQRVQADPQGEVRAYVFNPNNDSRQDWGQGIVVEVHGHGEQEGECSLPLHELASRLYAFHYTLYEDAWGGAVPEDEVLRVERLAERSWGAHPDVDVAFGP